MHTSARDVRDTDWSQVVALYDQLFRLDPSPIVALNRAVAIAELDGPDVALGIVDRLQDELADYHAYFAARADILRPFRGRYVARKNETVLVDAATPHEVVAWLREQGIDGATVFRVPVDPTTDIGFHGV